MFTFTVQIEILCYYVQGNYDSGTGFLMKRCAHMIVFCALLQPKFAASLQVLKVEIGGDSQSSGQ